MTIHLEATIHATPQQLYELLTDGVLFGPATVMPGGGRTAAGAAFSIRHGHTWSRQNRTSCTPMHPVPRTYLGRADSEFGLP